MFNFFNFFAALVMEKDKCLGDDLRCFWPVVARQLNSLND
jgi:hypothetical protein